MPIRLSSASTVGMFGSAMNNHLVVGLGAMQGMPFRDADLKACGPQWLEIEVINIIACHCSFLPFLEVESA